MKFIKKPDKVYTEPALHDKITQALGFLTDEPQRSVRGFITSAISMASRIMRREEHPLTIAIILSHSDNYWEIAAVRSMIDSLRMAYGDTHHFDFVVFSAENSRKRLNRIIFSQLLEAVGYHYHACVALAPWVVGAIRDTFVSFGGRTPIIFGGVCTPERLGFAGDLSKSMEGITGVAMGVPAYYCQVKTIFDLHDRVDELIIPYDSELTHNGLPERCYGPTESFARSWRECGGTIHMLEVTPNDDIAQLIIDAASPRSLVNLSMCSSVLAQTDEIIVACNMYNIPLYAHTKQGVRRGSVLGSGASGDVYGAPLASLVGRVCIHRDAFEDIPLPLISEPMDVCYFERNLASQGFIHLSDMQLRLMRMLPIHQIVQ